ncbi:uncharacterized protein LY79DRAFT_575596 [Colletotrichum navitas]|uniref:Uncharacterized protein n=1 Tax=Colletotrichum navitas TaxID=681940 RepID=A0AAD8VBI7_9PEZI|nr:uncharacterized protein LY79DRAFT_575596 [Colletotrichum navitas]KAK1599031.1 hypothetical protein LY79DRAFT_575596 [Colletotrichum navitas]
MPLFWVASLDHFSSEPAQLHHGRYLVLACAFQREQPGAVSTAGTGGSGESTASSSAERPMLQVTSLCPSAGKDDKARYEPKGMVVLSIDMSWRMVAQPLGLIRSSAPPQKSEAGVTAHRTYMDSCNQGWQTCSAIAMAIYMAAGCRQAGQYGYKIVVSA